MKSIPIGTRVIIPESYFGKNNITGTVAGISYIVILDQEQDGKIKAVSVSNPEIILTTSIFEAVRKAATELGLTLVSCNRTGTHDIDGLVQTSNGYYTLHAKSLVSGPREIIDNDLYIQLVEQMKSFAIT